MGCAGIIEGIDIWNMTEKISHLVGKERMCSQGTLDKSLNLFGLVTTQE